MKPVVEQTHTDKVKCKLKTKSHQLQQTTVTLVQSVHSAVQSTECSAVSTLPSSSQGAVRVEVQVVDSFTVTFLMKNFLLNLQVPQTPRVIVTTHKYKYCILILCPTDATR